MQTLLDIFTAIILGAVEGLTEFAPVSSTGHMILVGHLLGFEGTTRVHVFEVVIQLGAILSVIVMFWNRLLGILGLGPKVIEGIETEGEEGESKRGLNIIHVILGMIPAVVLGLLFKSLIDTLFNAKTVLIGLFLGAILMLIAELVRRLLWKEPRVTSVDEITYFQAFMIGVFQCFALWPGFSRSGSTISGGLLFGINHKAAAEYTFILAVPMMIAASGLDLYKSWPDLHASDLPLFIAGFVMAFIVALVVNRYFLQLINKIKLVPFAIYRIVIVILYWGLALDWARLF